MNNYLKELFETENTVIIPGFGALTMVNRSKNELMFMSFMKHNDGTLINWIAKKEGCDVEEAKKRVELFVDEINFSINSGKSFDIEGLGSFVKDSAGDIQFIQDEVTNQATPVVEVASPEDKVEVEIDEPAIVEEQVVEEVIEEKLIEEEEPISESHDVIQESSIIESTPDVEEKAQNNQVVSEEEPAMVSEEEQWNDDLDLPPINYKPERPKKPILEKAKKDKKKRNLSSVWLLLMAAIIFGGATLVGMYYSDIAAKIPFLATEKKEKIFEVDPSTFGNDSTEYMVEEEFEEEKAEESTQVEKEETQEETQNPEKTSPITYSNSGLRFDKNLPIQVIVGSFGQESNATRMVSKLKAEGLPAEILGVYNGLYTVSAASFASMDEVKANASELQKIGSYWIKK